MANYSVNQLALEFGRSEQYIRKIAKEKSIGSQVKGVWQFSEADRVSFMGIFNPDTRSFAEQMEAITAEFTEIEPSKSDESALALYGGASLSLPETEDWDFDSVIESVKAYNAALEEDLLKVKVEQQDLEFQHRTRMQILDAEMQKAEAQLQQLQIEKRDLNFNKGAVQSLEKEKMEKIVRLRKLGLTLKKS